MMTKRLEETQQYINHLLASVPFPNTHLMDKEHSFGVASCCVLLALKRGLNPELAAISGLLHDIYRYKTGISAHHSHNGAEMARVALKRAENPYTEDEKQIILSAIFHHGDKRDIHGAYDEVLKDADTLSPVLYTGGINHIPGRQKRLEKMTNELNLPASFSTANETEAQAEEPKKTSQPNNKRLALAETAERLAAMHITGSRNDAAYMNLIRYWPEEAAFDELQNAWCAAFVYHCCQEAGFVLPIKWLTDDSRFAGVASWNTWARRLGYFIKDEPGVTPKRGDILLYRNIIPAENKLAEQRHIPIDHIGIVLASDSESLTVAEGNVNHQNVSGILTRPLHQNIEGYIRIDNAFSYDNWSFDYMTRTEKRTS